jgi:RimJ/RimL family protein N-acetyltransferase
MGDLVPPDPPLAGAQVVLRPFRVGDAAAIAKSCQDPDIPRFTMMPKGMTEHQARQWVEQGLEWWPRGVARFAVTVPPSDECAGQVGIQFDFIARRAEAFYWLDDRLRGRGIAVEALNLVTEWALRDHGVVRAQLVTHLDNERSQRVAERCGFRREGVLRAWEPVKDEQPDVVMWSRLGSDPAPDLGRA